MKTSHLFPAVFHPLCVLAAPYIVTNYVELSVYTDPAYTYRSTTLTASLYTFTENVTPDVTPVSALNTYTADSDYTDVTLIEIVLPTGAGKGITYDDSTYNNFETSYVVPVTYSPAATCTSQNWTFTTNVPVYIPPVVTLPPVTRSTSVTTQTNLDYKPTAITQIIAVLEPTDVNADDLASASAEYAPYGLNYCYTPTTYCPTYASATCTPTFTWDSSSSQYPYFDNYENAWMLQLILIAVLVPVGWILIWLIVGLVESWMSFKGVMLGLHRKRGVPYAWCCINIFFLCCVGPTYKAKSAEEQAVLLERWNAMKKWEKFKLWMKWGFRWKYPDMLGEEPELAKRPFRQGCL